MTSFRYRESAQGYTSNYTSTVINRPMKIPQVSVDLLKIGRDVEFEIQLGKRKELSTTTSASKQVELLNEIQDSCELMRGYDSLIRKLLKDGEQ